MGVWKLVGMKQIVSGLLLFGGLVVLVIAQTAFATSVVQVEGTTLAGGTFDGLEASSQTDFHEVELRATGPTDVHILQTKSHQAVPSVGTRIRDRASSSSRAAY